MSQAQKLLAWINTHDCGVLPCGVLNADESINEGMTMNNEIRYDVMRGNYFPTRIMQWATVDEVRALCERMGLKIISDRQLGLRLREVTIG